MAILCFPEMFKVHLSDSNLKCPDNFSEYDKEEYPHFHIFLMSHLETEIRIDSLKEDADIIAKIPEDKIRNITIGELIDLGVNLQGVAL